MKKQFKLQEAIDKIYPYIKESGWDKETIGIRLIHLDERCGKGASSALCRFIDWSVEHKKSEGYIASTIGHDLNGAGTTCFSPRSIDY